MVAPRGHCRLVADRDGDRAAHDSGRRRLRGRRRDPAGRRPGVGERREACGRRSPSSSVSRSLAGGRVRPREGATTATSRLAGARVCRDGAGCPNWDAAAKGWVALQVVLIVVIVAAGLLGPSWPSSARTWLAVAAGLVALVGLYLFLGGATGLGRQLTPFPKPIEQGDIKRGGVYGLVRHPIYGGVLLLALAWSLVSSPLALVPWAVAGVFLDLSDDAKRRGSSSSTPTTRSTGRACAPASCRSCGDGASASTAAARVRTARRARAEAPSTARCRRRRRCARAA